MQSAPEEIGLRAQCFLPLDVHDSNKMLVFPKGISKQLFLCALILLTSFLHKESKSLFHQWEKNGEGEAFLSNDKYNCIFFPQSFLLFPQRSHNLRYTVHADGPCRGHTQPSAWRFQISHCFQGPSAVLRLAFCSDTLFPSPHNRRWQGSFCCWVKDAFLRDRYY